MNALWPIGEATVRDIQQSLYPTRPRAYTTIMTILDRLAQKGIVLRRKSGRAWVYRANLTADEARSHAVAQLIDGFFAGSTESLAKHLAGKAEVPLPVVGPEPQQRRTAPRPAPKPRPPEPEPLAQESEKPAASELDASLL